MVIDLRSYLLAAIAVGNAVKPVHSLVLTSTNKPSVTVAMHFARLFIRSFCQSPSQWLCIHLSFCIGASVAG